MEEDLFASPRQFRDAFVQGLDRLLEQDSLALFILVLANASYDPAIFSSRREALRKRFEGYDREARQRLARGQLVDGSEEDELILLKLLLMGFDQLQPTVRRKAGPWELQFNLLRSFRPQRMSQQAVTGIHKPFNPDGFHFNKPFLQQERIWSGEWQGRALDLYYNKYPFVDLHGLLLLDRQRGQPQLLTEADHRYVWSLAGHWSATLPGVGFAYNAYGAFASVNHQHFQVFVRDEQLPVMVARWQHNGGDEAYPLPCRRFEDAGAAWRYIAGLHEQETSYNLVYRPGMVWCLPRAQQGSYEPAAWAGGFAWYEVAGGIVNFDRQDFESLTAAQVSKELRKLSLAESR